MRCLRLGIALTSALLSAPAWAQPLPPAPPPTVIVIRPELAPVPALKYRIVPERRDLIPGNAAVFYHRAIEMAIGRRHQIQPQNPNQSLQASAEETLQKWLVGPIRDVPRDQAKTMLDAYSNALHEMELGATRQACDWEFEHRLEGVSLLLGDIQEMRALGRLVALRARVALLDGQTDEAIHWLQIGFVMSRHVSQGTSLIQSLVGCAIESSMSRGLEDLIQVPGTPSLYWALASRPRPFIDMTSALEGERTILEREVPALRELETGPWTLEKARRFGDDLRSTLGSWTGITLLNSPDTRTSRTAPPRLQDLPSRLALAAMVAKLYPEAKTALLKQGTLASEVEAMPTLQVVAIQTMREYNQFCDDVYKWTNLPYWQSSKGLDDAFERGNARAKNENPLLALFAMIVPAMNAARLAGVRVDRQLDALQCIEAIRLYAAAHNGALPPSLDAITEAPTPLDPATGKPFDYKVNGDSAALTAPLPSGAPNHWTFLVRYDLKLAR